MEMNIQYQNALLLLRLLSLPPRLKLLLHTIPPVLVVPQIACVTLIHMIHIANAAVLLRFAMTEHVVSVRLIVALARGMVE